MTFTLFLLCLSVTGVLRAQELSSRNEALKQICNQYDAQKKTAQGGALITRSNPRGLVHRNIPNIFSRLC
jgi:hypothetical protein